ncbi:hypothetical protein V3C97_06610 [Ligilactobacillus saerimneri]|uniref:hypothetical protein n=1 Tax=Ligilactobacillus saerimneri TaxID=228229 RepID=UPI0030D41738
MTKYFFKKDEVSPYFSTVDPFYGVPQVLKQPDPLHAEPVSRIEGVLYDSQKNLLWHSINRVTAIINDGLLPHQFAAILEESLIVGLKERKGVDAIGRKAKELGKEGINYKFLRSSGELYLADDLLHDVFCYFKSELPLKTSKRITHLENPSFESMKNTLADVILTSRTRSLKHQESSSEKEELSEVLEAFVPAEFIEAATADIFDIIAKNDEIRNNFLVKRLESLSNSFEESHKKSGSYGAQRPENPQEVWESAFKLAYFKLYYFGVTHPCEGLDDLILSIYEIPSKLTASKKD